MAMNPDALLVLGRKFVSNYDVRNKLAFPVGLMGNVWPVNGVQDGKKKFLVVDIWGRSWELHGNVRRDAAGHPKPEVCGPGWKSFKETKGLKVGDELIFYLPPAAHGPDDSPVFVLSVKREITLMGTPVSGHVSV